MPKLTKTQERMIRRISEEWGAALTLIDRNPQERDLYAAGVADGMRSCAAWLGIEAEAEAAAKARKERGY